MVKIENNFENEVSAKQKVDSSANQNSITNQNNQTPTKPNSLITTIGQLLPFAPLVFEQFTGQKIPQMSGTMAEVISSLQQIQTNLQTVVNNQQALSQRLITLETNASNQLTTLTQQFQSLRLTHTREQKQIELQSNGSDFDKSRQFNPNKITNQEENY